MLGMFSLSFLGGVSSLETCSGSVSGFVTGLCFRVFNEVRLVLSLIGEQLNTISSTTFDLFLLFLGKFDASSNTNMLGQTEIESWMYVLFVLILMQSLAATDFESFFLLLLISLAVSSCLFSSSTRNSKWFI